jgi:ADP-heptose:LPS heptosyltransferase
MSRYKNKTIHLINNYHNIGDLICSFPVMTSIAKEAKKVYIDIVPNLEKNINNPDMEETVRNRMHEIFELFPKKYNFQKYANDIHCDETISIPRKGSAHYSNEYLSDKIHMTQVNFKYASMKIPKNPVQPELQIPYKNVKLYDYLIAPYAYSLKDTEKLPENIWQEVINALSDRTFGILGSKYDVPFLKGDNINYIFDKSFIEVANIMKRSGPLISVVTGIGHLAYALGTPHILLTNQPFWSINPNAIAIIKSNPISFLPAKTLIKLIQKIEDGEKNIIIPKDFNYVRNEI